MWAVAEPWRPTHLGRPAQDALIGGAGEAAGAAKMFRSVSLELSKITPKGLRYPHPCTSPRWPALLAAMSCTFNLQVLATTEGSLSTREMATFGYAWKPPLVRRGGVHRAYEKGAVVVGPALATQTSS